MNIDINGLGAGRPDSVKRQENESKVSSKAKADNAKTSDERSNSDSVSLSSGARDIAQIENEILNLPEIDQAKVDAIKARIASGEYHIDFEKVAQKMLDMEK